MRGPLRIGGAPAVTLRADAAGVEGPAFLEATVLPGRGMMLLQARLRLPSGEVVDAIAAPDLADAARALDSGPDDFAGSKSFSFGGAILAPFANRIRGEAEANAREIATRIAGHAVRLPRNWGGKTPGSEQYAMHGLILDRPVSVRQAAANRIGGRLDAGDFGARWPGSLALDIEWSLVDGALALRVAATSVGHDPTPVGIGWHPYFRLASGEREPARLWLAARSRALVNNYDEVLPTGEIAPVAGSRYDFRAAGGQALGDIYLDDCFTDLDGDGALAELRDPAAGLGLRLSSPSKAIRALQVYAPPAEPFVVIEPQFNLANPYGAEWGERDTGMQVLRPGESVTYDVRVEPFALPARSG
ncbi:MAG: putative galactose mutarotase [Phenylobacterium sp.]|nr:putative galactose mutarotase [Phenylobacterium sp.]